VIIFTDLPQIRVRQRLRAARRPAPQYMDCRAHRWQRVSQVRYSCLNIISHKIYLTELISIYKGSQTTINSPSPMIAVPWIWWMLLRSRSWKSYRIYASPMELATSSGTVHCQFHLIYLLTKITALSSTPTANSSSGGVRKFIPILHIVLHISQWANVVDRTISFPENSWQLLCQHLRDTTFTSGQSTSPQRLFSHPTCLHSTGGQSYTHQMGSCETIWAGDRLTVSSPRV
jgi:hypothetical protein